MSFDEAEVLERLVAGDEEALITLHNHYAHLVYSVAYRVLNDTMAAEEVTQDTFMRLWRKSYTFDSNKGAFVPWLLTITRRLAIDTFRQQKRDALMHPLRDANLEGWENVLRAEEGDEMRRALIDVMKELPEDQRQVLELAYFYDMSHSQIADYLKIPLGTIKTRIRLGMQKLREAWLPEADINPKPGSNS